MHGQARHGKLAECDKWGPEQRLRTWQYPCILTANHLCGIEPVYWQPWVGGIKLNTLCLRSIRSRETLGIELDHREAYFKGLGMETWPAVGRDQKPPASSLHWLWAMIVDKVRGRYYIVINPLETTGPEYCVQSDLLWDFLLIVIFLTSTLQHNQTLSLGHI